MYIKNFSFFIFMYVAVTNCIVMSYVTAGEFCTMNWLQAKINIVMSYNAPEGTGGGGGWIGKDVTDGDQDEEETARLGSNDIEDTEIEPREGEKLTGESEKTSAATEEALV